MFACQYAEVYLDQLVDKFRQGMADLLLYPADKNSNFLVKILEIAPHCACKILQGVTGEQAAAAILKLPPDKGNALELACQHAPHAFKVLLAMQSPSEAAHNILSANHNGWNKLMVACRYASTEVEPLLDELPPEHISEVMRAKDTDGNDALSIATQYAPEVVPLLNSKRPSSPRTAFFTANPAGENDLKKRKTADTEDHTAFLDLTYEWESVENDVVIAKKNPH